MALINAYRRRIKRVNSQPLNGHKTNRSRDRSEIVGPTNQSTSLRTNSYLILLFPCHEIKPGNNETQSVSQAISMRAFIGRAKELATHKPTPNTQHPQPKPPVNLPPPPSTLLGTSRAPHLKGLPARQHSLYNHLTQR
ncbi:LOW QUALITY PROTEIN: uncharacterized protein LOC122618125 [Drosophila teissieri]|uniref:LOW QUALITY PROTEIN: uncharacterized protein LOC122618125 n=1 Tax=Drosophila teissieri TaxID=7243 RepID=UPI001CBA4B18|nr:LOW QUALITY PROTEIN: uncharacterized protein LOC122618125 [Drosophila teissieri]